MDDTPEQIAGDAWLQDSTVRGIIDRITAYGEACRRAGAEAMREAAADCELAAARIQRRPSSEAAIRALPLPLAAEAVSPAAGWTKVQPSGPFDHLAEIHRILGRDLDASDALDEIEDVITQALDLGRPVPPHASGGGELT